MLFTVFKSAFGSGPNTFCHTYVVRGQLGVNYSLHILTNEITSFTHLTWKLKMCMLLGKHSKRVRDLSHWSLEKIVELNIQRMKSLRVFVTWVNLPLPSLFLCSHCWCWIHFPRTSPSPLHRLSWSRHTPYTSGSGAMCTCHRSSKDMSWNNWTSPCTKKTIGERCMLFACPLNDVCYTLCVPEAKQVPCRICKCLCSGIYSLQWAILYLWQHTLIWFFQCLVTHKWKGRWYLRATI